MEVFHWSVGSTSRTVAPDSNDHSRVAGAGCSSSAGHTIAVTTRPASKFARVVSLIRSMVEQA